MIRWILGLIFLCSYGCTPTNETLAELTGADSTSTKITVPSDLGNQAFLFTPTVYDFGNRAVNSATVTTTVTIKNISSHTVYLSNISGLSGAFALVSDNCPRSPSNIVPNQSCTATVSFGPTAGGLFNQMMSLTYGEALATNTTYTAGLTFTGTGVGSLPFTGIDSVTGIYSSQLTLNWTHVAGALTYYIFRVNNDGSLTLVTYLTPPIATYIVSGLTASTTYKYWVRSTDSLGAFDTNVNIVTTATNTLLPAPVVIGHANKTFASAAAVALGNTLSMDFDDFRTGVATDAGVTYNCSYDQVINSAVTTSGNCTTLPGTISFITTSGALSWSTTTQNAIGFYEFKILATDSSSGLTNAAIFALDLKPAYTTTNLIGNFSANFSNAINNQTTETTWQDLTTNNLDGTLTNFSFGGVTGWLGAGSAASPYRLGFDGTNDYVDLNTLGNTASSMTFDTWAMPTQINTTPTGIIMSNADGSAKGLTLREAKGYRNRVEAIVGGTSYSDAVMIDTPVSYLRMGDVSGAAIYDAGSVASSWTPNVMSLGYEKTGAINSSDKSMLFNGTNSRLRSTTQFNPAAWTGLTYEIWANYSAIQYSTLFSHNTQNYVTGFFWFYLNGGSLHFAIANGVGQTITSHAWAPTLNTWYHIVATFDFASMAYNLYINGVNVKSVTVAGALVTTPLSNPVVTVGSYDSGAESFFNGHLDEAAVYDNAITGGRVTAHYNARNNTPTCLSNVIDVSKWNHLATSWNDATQNLKLFTNSNVDCSMTSSAISISGTSAQLSIGAKVPAVNSPTAGTFFKGEITDARVYDAAITASDVAINMASQMDKYEIPNSIAGLNLWLKADALVGYNNNDPVATWVDKSTAGRNATATATQEPLYIASSVNGKPALRFDGVNDQMTLPAGNGWTWFIVGKQLGAQGGGVKHFAMGTGVWTATATQFAGDLSWYHAQWGTYMTTKSGAGYNWHIQSFRGSTGSAEAWVDGVKSFTNYGTFTIGNLVTIGNGTGDIRWINGDITEIIAYSGALTEAERTRVEGYLRAKYGL